VVNAIFIYEGVCGGQISDPQGEKRVARPRRPQPPRGLHLIRCKSAWDPDADRLLNFLLLLQ
jgi:hypothetical protein